MPLWLIACSSEQNARSEMTQNGGTTAGVGGSGDTSVGGRFDEGGTFGIGTDGGPTEITSNNMGDLVFAAYCDFLTACEPKLGSSFPTRNRCIETMAMGLSDGFEHPIFWAKDASLYQIDRSMAERCLSKLAVASCTDGLPLWESQEGCYGSGGVSVSNSSFFGYQLQHLLESLAECQGVMVGSVGQNACCDYRGGCLPGLFCEEVDYESIGSCQPAGAALEACWTRPCQEGLACVNQICTAYAQLGDQCPRGRRQQRRCK